MPFQYVEDRLSHVTLQENFLVFTIFRDPRAFTNLCQKELGIENRLTLRSHTAILQFGLPAERGLASPNFALLVPGNILVL